MVLIAIKKEQLLSNAEVINDDVQKERRELVKCINEINSIANHRRKGRADLDVGILEQAISQQGSTSDPSSVGIPPIRVTVLARRITKSFEALRAYLRKISSKMERVDPNLRNNADLVDCLVEWEESWEIGLKFVRRPQMFNAFNDLVNAI